MWLTTTIPDADECYAAIVNSLRNVPGLDTKGKSVGTGAEAAVGRPKFIQQFMMGEMRRECVSIFNLSSHENLRMTIGYVVMRLRKSLLPFPVNRCLKSNAISRSRPTLCFLELWACAISYSLLVPFKPHAYI